MNNERENRLRLLCLYRLLLSESDAEHPLSTNDIIRRMAEKYHIKVHRTTIPKDVALLREMDIDVIMNRGRSCNYHLEGRLFELPELKLLIDAVEASRFITEKKSKLLIEKLVTLSSKNQADSLKRGLYNSGKVKSDNEKVLYVVDAIHTAINSRKQISFFYFDYSLKKRQVLKNNRKPYIVSPYKLIWNGDYYYLVGLNHQRNQINVFRVDRIARRPEVLQTDAIAPPEKFDVGRYAKGIFRMFSTDEPIEVLLLCHACVMKSVIDKFGVDVATQPVDTEHFIARVEVCTSPTFYAWVFQWGGRIRIKEPDFAAAEYQKLLQKQIT